MSARRDVTLLRLKGSCGRLVRPQGSLSKVERVFNAGSWFQGVTRALGFRGSGKNYLCTVLLNFVSRNQEDFKGRPRFRQEILKQEVSRGT